jgi:hypothetical protein
LSGCRRGGCSLTALSRYGTGGIAAGHGGYGTAVRTRGWGGLTAPGGRGRLGTLGESGTFAPSARLGRGCDCEGHHQCNRAHQKTRHHERPFC